MGVDVTLMPVTFESTDNFSCSTRLKLERRSELWDPLSKIPSAPCPKVTGYMGDSFGTSETDPYGTPLKYTLAKDLLTLAQHEAVLDNDVNRAVWAYLAALLPETKIVIYWH